MKEEIRKLQNHFDNGVKEGYQAKVHYLVGDRVHLKGTKVNGTVTAVIFKEDRSYPYLKIKWDDLSYEENLMVSKKSYDPFDVTKEIKSKHKQKREKKIYENFYLNERRKI